jgi:uroporphyrinogen-III decarboxylase
VNKRQDALTLLKGEIPEYVPWYGDLAYWIDYLLDDGLMPEAYRDEETGNIDRSVSRGHTVTFVGEGLHRLHEDLGVGFYLQGYFPFTEKHALDVQTEYHGDKRVTTYRTPYGDLTEVWVHEISTHSWAPGERLIKDWRDLKALRYLYENTAYEPDYDLAEKRIERVGDNGVVLVYAPKTPFQELMALKAGISALSYITMDAPEEFEETLRIMEKRHDEATKIAIASPAECIFVPENLSSELSGGMFYEKYIKSVHEKWTGWIKSAGKYSFVHLDGTLNPLISNLSKAGFDVIEGVTPYPAGDLKLEDLRSYVEDETIIWGGIPGGFFNPYISDEEFDRFVIAAIKLMRNNNRFVLGVGDQVSPGSTMARIKRVDELVKQYGKYDS